MFAQALTQLLPLLKAESEAELTGAALALWAQHQPLDKGVFLRLSFDGRSLEQLAEYPAQGLSTREEAMQFSCADFDQPFSHVVFNGKALCLQNARSAANLDHPRYQAWLESAAIETQLRIEPVYLAGKIAGLWALLQSRVSPQMQAEADLQALLALVAQQLAKLRQQHQSKHRQSELLGEIHTLHHNVQSHDQAQFLAQTIIGDSPCVKALHRHIMVAARSRINVLIRGETGVGKDLVASAIHQLSARCEQPYIALNCAAIPSALLESELFGYAKGAFSGASGSSSGLLGQADGGVLFLDEIGDMPLNIQAKLLRVLEDRRYRPLGASTERQSDFRLVAATHRDLPAMIEAGEFRSDLFYRLNSYPIDVAPLRERSEDVELLSKHFIASFNRDNQRSIGGIDSAVSLALSQRAFEGNIRQLKNLIDYACVHTFDGELIREIEPLAKPPKAVKAPAVSSASALVSPARDNANYTGLLGKIANLKQAVHQFEARIVQHRLESCGGNKTSAAQSLGMPRRTFTALCQRLANQLYDGSLPQSFSASDARQRQPLEINKS